MTNKGAIKRLQSWIDSGYYSLNNQDINWEDDKHALDLAIKALEFAESQGLCCDNCVNHNYKSKEVCTSPYGQCEFFEDET